MKTIDVFVPPGVQAHLFHRLGKTPRQAPPRTAAKITALWKERNQCAEERIAAIDSQMEEIMVAAYKRLNPPRPRWQLVDADTDGQGSRKHRLYWLRSRSLRDYWRSVTDVRCPSCLAGKVRWAEAGYVPGYRVCDRCGTHFLARGNAENPQLLCSP